MPVCVFLSLGSNCDDAYIKRAIEWLEKTVRILCKSDIYKSPSIGRCSSLYSNAVIKAETSTSIEELNTQLKLYEISQGRDEKARAEGRVPIDIDIVVADGKILRPRDFKYQFFQIGYLELTRSGI